MFLHLAHSLHSLRPTLHNGPGRRVSMWVQGCALRCTKRCLNPHMLAPGKDEGTPVETIIQTLRDIGKNRPFEGITVLGGEPSEQPDGLRALLEQSHKNGWSTMVYTGKVYEDLKQEPHAPDWLAHTDILVDGPYREEEYDDFLAWRGSRNQRLLCLSDRYTNEQLGEAFAQQGKGFSIQVNTDGTMSMSGIQNRDAAFTLEKLLRPQKR